MHQASIGIMNAPVPSPHLHFILAATTFLPPAHGPPPMTADAEARVLSANALPNGALEALLNRYGLTLCWLPENAELPGSYWGEREAGLIGSWLYLRADTPVHSVLHEACHWLLLSPERRQTVHTDAQSSDLEEHAVCYLQGLLAQQLAGYSMERLFSDMDHWGYTFRLGSAKAFFLHDSDDAQQLLRNTGWLPNKAPAQTPFILISMSV